METKNLLFDCYNKQLITLKDRILARERFKFYFEIIQILMLSKFKIKNCPDNIYSDEILKSLMYNGVSAMTNKLHTSSGDRNFVSYAIETGTSDYNDRYTHARVLSVNGQSDDLIQHKEIAIGYNNILHTPEYDIVRFANILAEVDTSIKTAVMNTRISPLLKANNENEKKALETAINDIYSGKLNVTVLNDLFNNQTVNASGVDTNRTIYLTNPNNVDKIQYLSKLHDDLIRRLCNLHGIQMNTTGKMAQLTTGELNEYSEFSGIYIRQQYDFLCEYIEESNQINNFNMSVEYGDSFKRFQNGEMKANEVIEEKLKDMQENEEMGVTEVEKNV